METNAATSLSTNVPTESLIRHQLVSFSEFPHNASNCSTFCLDHFYQPDSFQGEDICRLESTRHARRRIKRWYPPHSLYDVRSGFNACVTTEIDELSITF